VLHIVHRPRLLHLHQAEKLTGRLACLFQPSISPRMEVAEEFQPIPIEDYGVIGDMCSVALVSNTGSIDFFCYPRFN
jgi:hypothetical protein